MIPFSVLRLAFRVGFFTALRLAPKEDFTLNAKRETQNVFMRHGSRKARWSN
jgi:hypothetical protein